MDVTYNIVKGEKAYIGRLEIAGNIETRDHVIRREFELQEEELFNGKKLELDMFCKHPVLKNNAQAVKPTKKFLRLKNDMQYS